MKILYTDNKKKAESLGFLDYKIKELDSVEDNNQSFIYLIFNKYSDLKKIKYKGFLITFFESEEADLEIQETEVKKIKAKIETFLNLIPEKDIKFTFESNLDVSELHFESNKSGKDIKITKS